jgi:UDP-N-acetylmuramoylalanine--D-glutamate ligase
LPKRAEATGIKDKNVTVVGLARSGVGAANLLSELGADVTVTDIKTERELKDYVAALSPSVRLALGAHPGDIFVKTDMVVVSPGVRLDIKPLLEAKSKGIPVIGELELAYRIATNGSDDPPIPPLLNPGKGGFLAVTGTNGKSTTTALLDFMIGKAGFRAVLGGNIGNAVTEEIRKALSVIRLRRSKELKDAASRGGHFVTDAPRFTDIDFIVVEVSSFQLESTEDFRPKVAAIINITPDHLDRYHLLKEYSDTKAKIFGKQREEDFLVLNADDPETMRVASEKLKEKSVKPRVFYFSRREEVEGLYYKDGRIYCNLPDIPFTPGSSLITADEIRIKGVHNLENAMAASAMALLAGCPAQAVIESLKEFGGLEHRLEFVRELKGVRYFNDSKGTNVGAVLKSLEGFSQPVILIAGGRDKAGDFSQLRRLVKEKVKALVLIGEATEKMRRALGDVAYTVGAADLRDAVHISQNMSSEGDAVLLSPACASFDMFMDFEDRGRQFKKIVMELK